MVINELIIKNFGKFKDKHIQLDEGFNIIYGKNEAGKSTIHSFILGMLYGIEKSRVRKTIDMYEKYLPWIDPGVYEGVMKLTLQGNMYRIRRSFINKKAYCELREEKTGTLVDLKGQEPGTYLLGISESTFKDTVFVGQLSSRTSDAISYDIKSYIANLSTTMNTEIDLFKVYEKIDKEMKGNNVKSDEKQIKELESELVRLEQQETLRDSISLSLDEKLHSLEIIEEHIQQMEFALRNLSQGEIEGRIEKCKEIQLEIEKNKILLEAYKPFAKIKEEDLELILRERNQIKTLEYEIEQLKSKVLELKKNKNELEESILLKDVDSLEFIENKSGLEYYIQREIRAQAVIDHEEKSQEKSKNKMKYTMYLLLTIVLALIATSMVVSRDFMTGILCSIGIITLGGALVYGVKHINSKKVILNQEKIQRAYQEITTIGYIKPLYTKRNSIIQEIEKLEETIEQRIREKTYGEANLSALYVRTNIDKDGDIPLIRNKIKEYHQIENQIDKNETVLRAWLDGSSLNQLMNQAQTNLQEHDATYSSANEYLNYTKDELNLRLKQYRRNREELMQGSFSLKGKLEELESVDIRRTEVEEQLEGKKALQEKTLLEQQALKLAKDKLQQISEQIQVNYGKQLDLKVSTIIDTITNGKYNNINIDTDSNMSLDDGYHNIDIERLSLGTIDQMFLALRMGVDQVLHGELELPLLFDDSFALYDDERVKNLVRWLTTTEKQILLFTCQNRELDMAKEAKTKHVVVTL